MTRILVFMLLAVLGTASVAYGAYHAGQAHPTYAQCELLADATQTHYWYECPANAAG